MSRLLLASLLVSLSLPARADEVALLLAGARAGEVPGTGAVEAVLGQEVVLYAAVRRGRGKGAVYFTDAPGLRLGGRKVPAARLRPFSGLESAAVSWLRVEPHPHHVATDPPNPGNNAYSNSVLFGKRHGEWLGYDTLEYHESLIHGAGGSSLSLKRTHPTHPKVDVNSGLGTMRYKAVVHLPGVTLATDGAEAAGRQGIKPSVMRVTFLAGLDLLGRLRGFFNVPNVFGSAGYGRKHQTELYQGADCADVIIGAARAAGARIPYTSVQGLMAYTVKVSPRLLLREDGLFSADGKERVVLRYGQQVQPGDLVLIDYAGFSGSPRVWDHIGVLASDRGEPGVLDAADTLLHMGYLYGLEEEPAAEQTPMFVQIRRFNGAVARDMARARARAPQRADRMYPR